MNAEGLILFFLGGTVMVGAGMLTAHFLAPTSVNEQKRETYECGIPTEGPSWIQFRSGYYLFAILFLLFDVEVIFIVPWSVVMKQSGMMAFVEILIFFAILGLGLLYAWKKDALKWE